MNDRQPATEIVERSAALSPRPSVRLSSTSSLHRRRRPDPARRLPLMPHRKRGDVQGLRAMAVVAVVLDHLLGRPVGGFLGVDVFFVISGFLITGLLLREYATTGRVSFLSFYRRRIRRIIPVATTVLFATVLAALLVLPRERAMSTAVDGFFAAIFASNWRLVATGTDYFQRGLPPSPLQHYWSLSVEEQFYLLFPWVMVALLTVAARAGWSSRQRQLLTGAWIALITALSLGWALHETEGATTFAYFSTFSRGWELGVGALLAVGSPLIGRLPGWLRPPLAYLGLAGITISFASIDPTAAIPAPGALLPVLSTAAVIAAGTGASNPYDRWVFPLTNRVSSYLGDVSYSLYLWHFPVLVLMLAFLPADSVPYYAVVLVGTTLLAVCSFHALEEPIRRSTWLEDRGASPMGGTRHRASESWSSKLRSSQGGSDRRHRRRRRRRIRPGAVLGLALAAMIAITMIGVASVRLGSDGGTVTYATGSESDPGSDPQKCFGADFMEPNHRPRCVVTMLGRQTVPSVDELSKDTGSAYSCYRAEGADLKSCTYGSRASDARRVAIVGDSHAAMLIPALMPVLNDLNWRLDTYVGFGCQWKDPYYGDCDQVMEQIRARLAQRGAYDLVITSGARWVGGDLNAAIEGYAAAWGPVVAAGAQVVVVGDVPAVSDEALACIARVGFSVARSTCGTARSEALQQSDPLVAAAARTDGVHLVDLTSYYCRDEFCPSVIGGAIVYRDTASHVTASYMTSLSPYLLKRVEAFLR